MEKDRYAAEDPKSGIPQEFKIFKVKYPFSSLKANVVFWDGSEASAFFSVARDMGATCIYVYREMAKDADVNANSENDEFGFMISGVFHVFHTKSSAEKVSIGHNDAPRDISSDKGSAALARGPDELSDEMAIFVKANLDYMSPDAFNLQYFFKKFWESHGVDTSAPPGSEQRKFMTKVENMASLKIKKY